MKTETRDLFVQSFFRFNFWHLREIDKERESETKREMKSDKEESFPI